MGISNVSSNLRPGICTSTTRPTTPYEGQVIYETDTNRTLVWDNAAWISLAQSGGSGLVQIVPTSVSGTGSTLSSKGTVSVSSGGSSVTIEGCFNSDFQDYEVIVSNWRGSAVAVMNLQLRVGGSTSATGYYLGYSYGPNFYSGTGTMTAVGLSNQTLWSTDALCGTDTESGLKFTVYQPNLAKTTGLTGLNIDARTGGNARHGFSGWHNVATAYTSLVLSCNSGNFTTLSVKIYGYNQ